MDCCLVIFLKPVCLSGDLPRNRVLLLLNEGGKTQFLTHLLSAGECESELSGLLVLLGNIA